MSDEVDDIGGESEPEVPEGAAVFPFIPEELGIDPLLLAVLHATVFLAGSAENIVQPDAADEAVQYLAAYLQRLEGDRLRGIKEDLATLVGFAKQEKWPRELVHSLKTLLSDYGIEEGEAE